MAINKYLSRARLAGKITHNHKYLECSFELLQPFFKPILAGQYVSFKIGLKQEVRSYSVCGVREDGLGFDLLIDVTPQGLGTLFLQGLQVGDEVEILGPLGKFYLSSQVTTVPVVLIGTGSGIAPLRAMVRELLLLKKTTQPLILLWGERFATDLIWQVELRQLEDKFPNFKFMPAISRPDSAADAGSNSTIQPARVTDLLKNLSLAPQTEFYLCGNRAMLEEVQQILADRGVPATQVFFEKFY